MANAAKDLLFALRKMFLQPALEQLAVPASASGGAAATDLTPLALARLLAVLLSDMTLGDGVIVRPYCVLRSSRVAAHAEVGPFAHFRHAVDLGEGARIGNFVEAKKAVLGRGAKANHLSCLLYTSPSPRDS